MNFDEKVVDRIKKLEREVERLRVKESPIVTPSWRDFYNTPSIFWSSTPPTVSTRAGRFTVVGNTFFFRIFVQITDIGSGNSTYGYIGNLSMLPASGCAAYGVQNITSATYTSVAVHVNSSANQVQFFLPAAINRNGNLYIQGFYEVA